MEATSGTGDLASAALSRAALKCLTVNIKQLLCNPSLLKVFRLSVKHYFESCMETALLYIRVEGL